MPINLLLENDHSFNPEEIAALVAAFEGALQALKLTNREDQVTKMVAKLIIDLAKTGTRDPATLRDEAVKAFSR